MERVLNLSKQVEFIIEGLFAWCTCNYILNVFNSGIVQYKDPKTLFLYIFVSIF